MGYSYLTLRPHSKFEPWQVWLYNFLFKARSGTLYIKGWPGSSNRPPGVLCVIFMLCNYICAANLQRRSQNEIRNEYSINAKPSNPDKVEHVCISVETIAMKNKMSVLPTTCTLARGMPRTRQSANALCLNGPHKEAGKCRADYSEHTMGCCGIRSLKWSIPELCQRQWGGWWYTGRKREFLPDDAQLYWRWKSWLWRRRRNRWHSEYHKLTIPRGMWYAT